MLKSLILSDFFCLFISVLFKSCPLLWECNTIVTAAPATQATTQAATTQAAATQSGTIGSVSSTSFPSCQFRFGMAFDGNSRDYSVADYITMWIGSPSST
jgi:hypothetical protein